MTSGPDTARNVSEFAPSIDVALCRGEPSPPAKKPDMRQLTVTDFDEDLLKYEN